MSTSANVTNRRKETSLTRVRRTFLFVSVVGAFLVGVRHILPGEASRGGSFDAFCPFGAVESLWSYWTTGQMLRTTNLMNFAVFAGVVGVALVAGRAFCGWMCPLGGLQEFLAIGARRLSGGGKHVRGKRSRALLPLRIPGRIDHGLRYLKYFLLAAILLKSASAVFPPLHDQCPARAVFSFQIQASHTWVVLAGFLTSSLLVERFSCKYLCPLGAILAIFNKFAPLRVFVDRAGCSGCGRCGNECPMDVENIPENPHSLECIQCLECLETCARKDTMSIHLG